MRNGIPLLLAGLLLPFAAGCGEGGDALAPVHGTVFYQGLPLRHGTIVFIPDEDRGCRGPLASADIQPDGTFVLRSGDAAGAVPGWHRVTVAAVETAPGQPPRSVLPAKYSDPALSGLRCEVGAGKNNSITFRLD